MKLVFSNIFVDDQEKALSFYTEKLGFIKKEDIMMGEVRWLTLVAPDSSPEFELVLEPDTHPAAKTFRKVLFDDRIPTTSFLVDDVQAEYERLLGLGVEFKIKPLPVAKTVIAVFDDTCGNLIQLHQPPS